MTRRDRDYYLRRAEAELAMAACAAHPSAMRSHYYLAGFYLDKAYGARSDAAARSVQPAAVSNDRPVEAA
jgi:hypothetical protein